MSLIRKILYQSDVLAVRHVTCLPEDSGCGNIEQSNADVLVLPLRGVFTKYLGPGEEVLAEPSQALFFGRGRPYRVSHTVTAGDESLALEFSPTVLREVLKNTATSDNLFLVETNTLLTASAIAARNLLWWRLEHKIAEPLEVEETGIGLLSSASVTSRKKGNRRRKSPRSKRLEHIDAARLVLLKDPEQKWTLATLAHNVGCSPYHLTRIFQLEIGVPLHQFQLRSRIAKSIDALLDTNQEITAIALDYGFTSHSHYTAAFRKNIGITPAKFRLYAKSQTANQTRKNLIARLFPNPLD